jgi:RNA polymerase sigma-70 factor (sigma-E family)
MDSSAADFDAYVRARTPALLRSAYLLTGDQHLAEDLVQDALIRTHRAWRRIADSNPDAYTRKVMYHLNISRWRRGRSAERSIDRIPERAEAGRFDTSDDRLVLRHALNQLPPKRRAVIVLRFFEDLTEAATADVLGISIGTVKSQTSKALVQLRKFAPKLLEVEGMLR